MTDSNQRAAPQAVTSADRQSMSGAVSGAIDGPKTEPKNRTGGRSNTKAAKTLDDKNTSVVITIFGASGDLTKRKLMPALLHLAQSDLLPTDYTIVGYSRSPLSHDEFRKKLLPMLEDNEKSSRENCTSGNAISISKFLERVFYVHGAYDNPSDLKKINVLGQSERQNKKSDTPSNHLFYLATPPEVFAPIVEGLGQAKMVNDEKSWARVVIEKPFGHDLASAKVLNSRLRKVLKEEQIYRIDHYLGKETVQNIIALRFANAIFEPIWNRNHIESVSITVAEKLGVEQRADYYESAGALRDMVPNHLLQLLSLIAMEPPAVYDSQSMQSESLQVLKSMVPLNNITVKSDVVRGQYTKGEIQSESVPGYLQEPKVNPESKTETYVAIRAEVDNWRWAGVPFYLRTGKRMKTQSSVIEVRFRSPPVRLFAKTPVDTLDSNLLTLKLQPEQEISLHFGAKVPGIEMIVDQVKMKFSYDDHFKKCQTTGYETLLFDAIIGDSMLFKSIEQVEAGWAWVQPILDSWAADPGRELQTYAAGSQGPERGNELLKGTR